MKDEVTEMKICSKCGKLKPKSEFHRKSASKDGLMTWCKECDKKRKKESWERNKFSEGLVCENCGEPRTNHSKEYCEKPECKRLALIGKRPNRETRTKMSEAKKKVGKWVGKDNPKWTDGTSYTGLHNKAYELFGKDYCEGEALIRKIPGYRNYRCGITLEEYLKPDCKKRKDKKKRVFDMHCTSKPKDYTIMEQSNWICVCDECHDILEGIGENHPESKLTRKDVIYILENLLEDKPKEDKELADKFKVTRRVVWLIRTNQAWKHIVPEKREYYSRLYYEKVARKPRTKPTEQVRQNILRDIEEGILTQRQIAVKNGVAQSYVSKQSKLNGPKEPELR
jgi:hypothetical protein